MLRPGDTFYIPLPSSTSVPHLWIVLSEPDANGIAVCVNATSRKPDSDLTTILRPGDHPRITHESCIFYGHAAKMDLKKFEELVKRKSTITCKTEDPCSKHLLERIRQGLIISKETPREIKAFCKIAWGP